MKLPPEIRNKIYRLISTTHHFGRLDRYYKEKYRPYRLKDRRDQDTVVQPGLICCSRQTRSEGLPIFLRDHHFLFDLGYWESVLGIRSVKELLPWLNKLDISERKNIRNITLICQISPRDVPIMHIIHAKLSDEIRVVYNSRQVGDRSVYVTSVLGVVSTFQSWAIAKVGLPTMSKKHLAYLRSNPGRLSLDEGSDSLTFLPGLHDMGKEHEVGGNQ